MNLKFGFLLIEVIMSVLVVSFFCFLASCWYCRVVDNQRNAVMQAKALLVASNSIEYLRLNKKLPNKKNNYFDIDFIVEPENSLSNFNYVAVIVSWKEGQRKNHLTLRTGAFFK